MSKVEPAGCHSILQARRISLLALTSLLLAMLMAAPSYAQMGNVDSPPAIVISEIHYKPEPVTERTEFVEIYNGGATAVDLSGWLLDGGIDYLFPSGTLLNPDAFLVIAHEPASVGAKYEISPLGSFEGKLGNDGDHLILRDSNAVVVDEVSYAFGFPWPTVSVDHDRSIQLINVGVDNSYPGAWRSGWPTPGRPNAETAANAPPFVDEVVHSPKMPASADEVTISARIVDADGVASATLLYQVVEPGNYVAVHDDAFQQGWTQTPMAQIDENRWQAVLPASLQQHRRLIRYRIHARDHAGSESDVPYADDPQPNFAYFVYDGMPAWTASVDGGSANRTTFDFGRMRPLPVYHFIAKKYDVADGLFMPPSRLDAGYPGDDYLWRGTLVYDGVVYDHVTFRARGGLMRYAAGKNMWKINFHPGHRFQAHDDHGRPYAETWDKLNLSAVIQLTHRGHRGEQGLFESMSYRLFNLAGVEGPRTHFAHLRVIDDIPEIGPSQYEGDFWGLYLAVEQMDGRFLKAHALPDGNLYKMEITGPEKNNQGATAGKSHHDITTFMAAYQQGQPDEDWWRANFDLERYYSYRSILEAIHHYDIDQGKNYVYYRNPETERWSVHPWDVDLTWSEKMAGSGQEPFLTPVLGREPFQIEYQNRLREIRDLLFNPDQIFPMLAEQASFIDTPADANAMVDADRFLWDHNPIYDTRYVISQRSRAGHFYRAAEHEDFRGMVELMKRWVESRGEWIDVELLRDVDHPHTPTIEPAGPAGFPADSLAFAASAFQDPQGAHTFAAMEWRLAEVTDAESPHDDAAEPWHYEIDAVVESGELSDYVPIWPVPSGLAEPGHTYRARVRMKDNSGRWSHWSPPLQFRAGAPIAPPPTTLAITEIMYHPTHFGPRAGDDLEFVELTNVGSQRLDLTGVRLSDGIDYQFAAGTLLQPGERLVLASDRIAFEATYDIAAFDEYDRQLSNGGERLTLADAYGRTIFSVEYDDKAPWPQAADGRGHSLVLVDEETGDLSRATWRQSTVARGSPGVADPLPVLINELLTNPDPGDSDHLELYNPGDRPAAISHWYLSDDLAHPRKYRIAAGTVIPPNGYWLLTDDHLLPAPDLPAGFDLDAAGGAVYLFSAEEDGRLTGYRHGFSYGASERGVSFGRVQTSDGIEHLVAQKDLSLGAANPGARVGPVVFSEINYHPDRGDESIELTNISDQTIRLYDPEQPQDSWRIEGIFYDLPTGLALAPGERLLIVPSAPTDVCLSMPLDEGSAVVGPYPVMLSDAGQSITLLKPLTVNGTSTYVAVDQVIYDDVAPWPAMAGGHGASLRRVDLTGYGNEPQHWQERMLHDTVQSADLSAPYASLCSFEAYRNTATEKVEVDWVSHTERAVVAYRLWRSDDGQRDSAALVEEEVTSAQGIDSKSAHYHLIDPHADATDQTTYWLEAVGEAGNAADVAFTRLRQQYYHLFLPVIDVAR